jgi:hypothetical protein
MFSPQPGSTVRHIDEHKGKSCHHINMDVAYKYEELPAERCIRLIRLLPGVSNEQIRLELFTAELDTAPAYEAISYCWGDANDQQDVICCGKTMQITRSLYTGLQCFRHHDETRILWADAICINQSSDDEKGIQVSMMGDVYDLAARVLVWLGEASEEVAKKAFDLIRRLNDYIESQIVESELVINPLEAFLNVPRLQNLNQIFQSQSHMQALDNLFRRPVGIGGDPISCSSLFYDSLLRQWPLPKQPPFEKLLTPPLPSGSIDSGCFKKLPLPRPFRCSMGLCQFVSVKLFKLVIYCHCVWKSKESFRLQVW